MLNLTFNGLTGEGRGGGRSNQPIHRVEFPKFGHPALSSEFKNVAFNTEFVAVVGMLRKITYRKLKQLQNSPSTNNKKSSFLCKNYDFNLTELWTECPNLGHTK